MRLIFAIISLLTFAGFFNDRYEQTQQQANQGKPLFTFGIVADVQYCDCDPVDTRFYRSALPKLKQALTTFKSSGAEFVVNLGDLIDHGFESYLPVMHILDSSGMKVYHVTGNHDYYVDEKMMQHIPQLADYSPGFYSFIEKGFRLIFLNGNEVSIYATRNKKIIAAAGEMIANLNNMGEPNGKEHNGALGADQLVWLEEQLNEADRNSEKVLIFCHFPVWPVSEHNLLNYRNVLELLGKHHNIVAWFNGHNHSGNYGNLNKTHFVNLKGMCETASSNSFALIEIYQNRIWVKGEGREKNQILAF